MLISELFDLPAEKISGIANKLLEDLSTIDLIGYILTLDESILEEMIDYPEDYETGSEIKSVYPKLDAARENEINNGAKITDNELIYLKEFILEKQGEDGFEGTNYMTLNISCTDGIVLAVFYGQSAGNYVDWSFLNLYQSRDDLIKSIKSNLDDDERFHRI